MPAFLVELLSCLCRAQLLMNIPFTALYFASYETAKQALIRHSSGEESLLIQVTPCLLSPSQPPHAGSCCTGMVTNPCS